MAKATNTVQRIAAVLVTLEETGGGPESSLYLALGGDIHEWYEVKTLLLASGLVTIRAHWVTLTAKGRTQAQEVKRIIEKAEAAMAAEKETIQ